MNVRIQKSRVVVKRTRNAATFPVITYVSATKAFEEMAKSIAKV